MKNIKVTLDAHRLLKIFCAEKDLTMSEAIVYLLRREKWAMILNLHKM